MDRFSNDKNRYGENGMSEQKHKLLDIFNPIFNVKEVCKEFVLLEDHLSAPGKHCPDCIRKHLLRAEAFAEEAIALDKEGKWKDMLAPLPQQIRDIGDAYSQSDCDKHMLGQSVRKIRKSLSPLCFEKKNGSADIDLSKKVFKAEKVEETTPVWDFWSGVASGVGIPVEFVPSFCKALQSLKDSDMEPYFELSAPNVSMRVRSNTDWVQKRLINLINNSIVRKMVIRTQNDGKKYGTKDWAKGIAVALGKLSPEKVSFEAPSSSLGEYVENRQEMKRAYQAALQKSLYGLIKKARRLEKNPNQKSQILSAVIFEKIGDASKIPYFWAKAAQMYSFQNKSSEEVKALSKIIKAHPEHELKFWIANRVVIFDKQSQKLLQQMIPTSHEEVGSKNESKLKDNMKLIGPIAIGFALGLL